MPDATFYDGETARARAVSLAIGGYGLSIREADAEIAWWALDDLREGEGPPGILRLTCQDAPPLARLDVSDAALQIAIRAEAPNLGKSVHRERTGRIVFWSLAAAASLIGCVVFLMPVLADRLTPLIPVSIEKRLGTAVDNQVRLLFDTKTCVTNKAGTRALDRLVDSLRPEVETELDLDVMVLDSKVENAIALPGGRIYLFRGLLDKAENPDEVAGVLAHEAGHVLHRDGLRALIRSGGTSFLLGLLFGDITGGTTIVLATRIMLDNAYSRDAERAADEHAAITMADLGRSPRAMGLLLERILEDKEGGLPPILSSHPITRERLEALSGYEPSVRKAPILSDEEWRALKGICTTG